MLQVEIFEEENEEDLKDDINAFLEELDDNCFLDIKYSSSHFINNTGDQIFSFSAVVIYKDMLK